MVNINLKRRVENFVYEYLEDHDFEELLEEFDLTPSDVMLELFQSGQLDTELLEKLMGEDYLDD